MAKVTWTPRARSDLVDILVYIRRDNRPAARRFHGRLKETLDQIAEFPKIGALRPELGRRLRSLPFGNYLVFYRPLKSGIVLARVVHGGRDLRRVFKRKK